MDYPPGKKPDDELPDSEQWYRHLFRYMPIAIFRVSARDLIPLFNDLRAHGVTDLSAYIDQNPGFLLRTMEAVLVEEANEQAIQMFGAQSQEQLLGPVTPYWQKRPDSHRRALESRFQGATTFQEETKMVTLDGREIDVLYTAARLEVRGQPGMSLVGLVDITERVQAQKKLHQVQADFAHAARISMLGEMAASIAHEVSQPLATIRTYAEAGYRWLNRPDPNVAKGRDLMQRIVNNADRANDVISRIRAIAAGRAPQQTALALHDVIEDSVIFLRHEFQSKGIDLTFDLAPRLPQVTGDRTQLQQVIVNLAVNAVQAMAQSEKTNRTLLIRTGMSDSETVSCSFEDSGSGIAQQHLDHLFDSFFTTKEIGMGMGLPICRSIIEAHGGCISVDNNSKLGGARFLLALPANKGGEPAS
jgi:PAS domain S-box-containing protein